MEDSSAIINFFPKSDPIQITKEKINDDKCEQITEISIIKEKLAREEIACDVSVLQKAILISNETEREGRLTIKPSYGLFVNPFSEKKKKSKKGKKSKKK